MNAPNDVLRSLLAAHGPGAVLAAMADVCGQAAASGATDDAELWECAAEASREAAHALEPEDDDAEELADGEPDDEDKDDDDQEGDDDAPGAAPAHSNETTAPAAHAAEPPDVTPPRAEAISPKPKGKKMITKDERLGNIPNEATHWRCKRLEDGRRTGPSLKWDHQGVAVEEWPLRQLSVEAMRERWGPGKYLVCYIREDGGKRRPCGNSRTIEIMGPPPRERATVAAPAAPAPGGLGDLATLMSLMQLMNQQAAEARRAAAEESRHQQELALAREKLLTEHRIAEIQANAAARPAGDAMLTEIRSIHQRFDRFEQGEDDDDDDDDPEEQLGEVPKAPPTALEQIHQIAEHLSPVIEALIKKFFEEKEAAALPAGGGSHEAAAE